MSPGLWPDNWSFIIAAPAASRSSLHCWSWSPNPTVSRAHWPMQSAISPSKLTVKQLANAAHLSPRQFSRAFRAETGQSPAKAVENLRIEAARLMMEQSRHPIDVIARQTGFGDRDRMRRAFLRAFGQPPQVIRRNARAAAAA